MHCFVNLIHHSKRSISHGKNVLLNIIKYIKKNKKLLRRQHPGLIIITLFEVKQAQQLVNSVKWTCWTPSCAIPVHIATMSSRENKDRISSKSRDLIIQNYQS